MKRISIAFFIFFSLAAMEHETGTEAWIRKYRNALAEAKVDLKGADQHQKIDILLKMLKNEKAKRSVSAPKIDALTDLLMDC